MLTLGCPKNTVDSEGMGELLRQAGYEESEEPSEAQVLIVNTCGFIDIAKEESLEALRELARIKQPGQLLIAAGCLAQRYGRDLAHQVPALDGIIGTQHWTEIADFVNGLRQGGERWVADAQRRQPIGHPVKRRARSPSAYLKIAEGCSAPCAFCAIPAIKGPYRSKPVEAILDEARQLVGQGVKEIILIAQDTTAYGHDRDERDALAPLIEEILHAVPDLAWLRVMYTYPQHITPRLIETMARYSQVCHYLDMPLQHAHPQTLRRMGRPSDMGRVRRLIEELRGAIPDISLRTSFIVGYPGETEEEFEALLDFMEEAAFDKVGVFTYSREEGTLAAELPGQIPRRVKERRRRRAMELQQRISLAKNRQVVGRTLDVLIEGAGDGISVGRSYRDAPEVDGLVLIEGELPVGQIVPVRITGALEYDLVGEIVAPCEPRERFTTAIAKQAEI